MSTERISVPEGKIQIEIKIQFTFFKTCSSRVETLLAAAQSILFLGEASFQAALTSVALPSLQN